MSVYIQGYTTTITLKDGPLALEVIGIIATPAEHDMIMGHPDNHYQGGAAEWDMELDALYLCGVEIDVAPEMGRRVMRKYFQEAEDLLNEDAGCA